ncbi:ketopantoate reductase family protein [Microvirga ossetica]|uniref:ketopantoate reductase family protein n=1 Tax=Microvirga ossetica TaxID=1882682 RepID=UPI001300009F
MAGDALTEPVVIWGAGAIGGTLGAYWARAGVPVLLVDLDVDHVEACRTQGLQIEGPIDTFTQVIPAAAPGELAGTYGKIVLAVKAHQTVDALAALKPHLREDGYVLSAQNGLNEITIAQTIGIFPSTLSRGLSPHANPSRPPCSHCHRCCPRDWARHRENLPRRGRSCPSRRH